jgi:teichuronic acid biosynthesis glycosyltransferase TuaG
MVEDLVSIVMPLYNKQAFLAEAVESVIQQGYSGWELIIVDDGSRDGSLAIAQEYARTEPRIRVVSLTENRGVSHARNIGIAKARGRYLAFLDSDDLWISSKLSVQVKFMKDSSAAFSFSQFRQMTPKGKFRASARVPRQVTYESLLRGGNPIGCLTVMLDRAKVGEISMPNIRHEDYVTWLAILKRGHVAFGIKEDLAIYRISPLSVTGDKAQSAIWAWQVYRRNENLPLSKSIWCFLNYAARALYARF